MECKRLLVGEDILENDMMVGQILYHFLEDKEFFDRQGNDRNFAWWVGQLESKIFNSDISGE